MPKQMKLPLGTGTGAGFSAVRGIIEAPAGAKRVASRERARAAFRIHLPTTGPDQNRAQSCGKSAVSKSIKMLVIDDDMLFAELLCRMLKKIGFAAVVLTDPDTALCRVKKNPGEFDVIITDQIMPKQSGLDLAAAIREVRLDVPIILLTGNENLDPQSGGIRGPVSLVLNKPINMQTLAEAVRKVTAAFSYPEQAG